MNEFIYYVWELTDSHATYIWKFNHVQRDGQKIYEQLECSINLIKKNGRNYYKRLLKDNGTHADFEFFFIFHKISDGKAEPFQSWKSKVDSCLNAG